MKRFHVKVRSNSNVSKYCVVDTGTDGEHDTIVINIPDYLGQRKEFTHMLVSLLNNNNKYKLPKTLV